MTNTAEAVVLDWILNSVLDATKVISMTQLTPTDTYTCKLQTLERYLIIQIQIEFSTAHSTFKYVISSPNREHTAAASGAQFKGRTGP